MPNFGQQPRFIVSINPKRCVFSPAAQMCLPNLDGLPPGRKTEMYSWDDDLNEFVSIGTGTVTEDGTQICTDQGVGVIKGGWHCGGNPSVSGGTSETTCKLDKSAIDLEVGDTAAVVASGSPAPPSEDPFYWLLSYDGIPESERGEISWNVVRHGSSSTATITGIKQGKVNLVAKYRCISGQWSTPRTVKVNVSATEGGLIVTSILQLTVPERPVGIESRLYPLGFPGGVMPTDAQIVVDILDGTPGTLARKNHTEMKAGRGMC